MRADRQDRHTDTLIAMYRRHSGKRGNSGVVGQTTLRVSAAVYAAQRIIMPSPLDSVGDGEDIVFLGCPSAAFGVRSFVRSCVRPSRSCLSHDLLEQ